MLNSAAIIENMMYIYIILVIINILIHFHTIDSCVALISPGHSVSLAKYQQSLERALLPSPSSIPLFSASFQFIKFSLQVYLRRISEITIISITPTVFFHAKGN